MSSNGQSEQDISQKRRYWKAHIESWGKSGLSQVDNCRVNNSYAPPVRLVEKRLKSAYGDVSFIPIQLAEQLPVAVEKRPFVLCRHHRIDRQYLPAIATRTGAPCAVYPK